jgi:hypothetical protein
MAVMERASSNWRVGMREKANAKVKANANANAKVKVNANANAKVKANAKVDRLEGMMKWEPNMGSMMES